MNDQLELARELVLILEEIDTVKAEMQKTVTRHNELDQRRVEIMAELAGSATKPKRNKAAKKTDTDNSHNDNDQHHDDTNDPELASKPTEQNYHDDKTSENKLNGAQAFDAVISGKAPITPATVSAHRPEDPPVTEETTAAIKSNLTALKEAEGKPEPVTQRTPAQIAAQKDAEALYDAGIEKRSDAQMRMIFALLGNHNINTEIHQKDVIWGVIAQQHGGVTLTSTKDLSKVWATGLIDFLNKAKPGDLNKYLKEPF